MARYETRSIWPPFKGKAYKVVDTSSDTGVGLYRTLEGAQRKAKQMNTATNPALDALRRNVSGKVASGEAVPIVAVEGPRMPFACPSCDQMSDTAGVCQPCRKLDRAPQGETVRLFEPAPTQLEGQMSF